MVDNPTTLASDFEKSVFVCYPSRLDGAGWVVLRVLPRSFMPEGVPTARKKTEVAEVRRVLAHSAAKIALETEAR